jgi:chromosome partitioning protein
MKIIGIVSQKGGSGKTTLAIHLSIEAIRNGLKTVVFDLDPQASISVWSDAREEKDLKVISVHAQRLEASINQAKKEGVDLVIIDSAPNANDIIMAVCRLSDLILTPCRPSALDLHATRTTVALATSVGKTVHVILNAIPASTKVGNEAQELLKGAGIKVSNIMLNQLIGFSHCLNDGLAIQELSPKSKASEQIKKLYAWVQDTLNFRNA